jgi:hypothetical protein
MVPCMFKGHFLLFRLGKMRKKKKKKKKKKQKPSVNFFLFFGSKIAKLD